MAQVPVLQSFPSTKPAMVVRCGLAGQYPVGDVHSGSTIIGVPLSGGTIESVGDFEPKMNFKVSHGHDWFHIDADKKHGRLNIASIGTDDQNRSIRVIAEGVVELNDSIAAVMSGTGEAISTPFGYGVEFMKIQTGHPEYKELENMLFAGSPRFIKTDNGEVIIEIRLARIMPGSGNE